MDFKAYNLVEMEEENEDKEEEEETVKQVQQQLGYYMRFAKNVSDT
jgi:hypothetical protein